MISTAGTDIQVVNFLAELTGSKELSSFPASSAGDESQLEVTGLVAFRAPGHSGQI